MIDWFVVALRHYAELAFFLAPAISHLLGKLHFGGFSLGAVTGTLLAGLLVGQFGVTVFPDVKQCFPVPFSFSTDCRCGLEFFQGLRKGGLSQVAVATFVATTGLVVVYFVARAFSCDPETAGGVVAGSLTESATIGTTGDAIPRLEIDDAARAVTANNILMAFAMTYLIGVVGAAWFLAQIGPRLIGVDHAKAVPSTRHGSVATVASLRKLSRPIAASSCGPTVCPTAAMSLASPSRPFFPASASALSVYAATARSLKPCPPPSCRPATSPPSMAAARFSCSRSKVRLPEGPGRGTARYSGRGGGCARVTNPNVDGKARQVLFDSPPPVAFSCAAYCATGMERTISWDLRIQRGDILTLAGSQKHIEDAVRAISVPDRPEELMDMVFVSAVIVIGRPDRDSGVGFRQIGTWTVPECRRVVRGSPLGMVPCHATNDWPHSHTYSMA